ISGRSSDTTYEQTENLNPGKTSSVTAAPPRRWRRSRTSVFLPARARYAAAVRPLWPPPTTTAAYFIYRRVGKKQPRRSCLLFRAGVFVHRAALHDESDPFELRDVAKRIAGDRNDVGELAAFDRADTVAPPHDLGGRFRRGDDCPHRRLTQ